MDIEDTSIENKIILAVQERSISISHHMINGNYVIR